jgi:hypothetical protein
MILLPICLRICSPRSNASLAPPTIKVSVPSLRQRLRRLVRREKTSISNCKLMRTARAGHIDRRRIDHQGALGEKRQKLGPNADHVFAGRQHRYQGAGILTESAALCASEMPALDAPARASSPRSNPATSNPALTRLAAIGAAHIPETDKGDFIVVHFPASLSGKTGSSALGKRSASTASSSTPFRSTGNQGG